MPVMRKLGLFGNAAGPTPKQTEMRAPTKNEETWDLLQDKLDWIPGIVKDFTGIPRRDVPRDDYQIPALATNWFSSPEAAKKSAAGLAEYLKNSKLSKYGKDRAEKFYKNFSNAFAHSGGIEESNLGQVTKGELRTSTRFADHLEKKPVLDAAGNPRYNAEGNPLTVWKLKPESEKELLANPSDPYTRARILSNKMHINKKLNNMIEATTPNTTSNYKALLEAEGTVRHEGGHTGQFIRDPQGFNDKYELGRGQLGTISDSPIDHKHLDYALNPREIGVDFAREKGLNRSLKKPYIETDPVSGQLEMKTKRIKPPTLEENINNQLARAKSEIDAARGKAPLVPQFVQSRGSARFSGIGKPKTIKLQKSKADIDKAETKILGRSIQKIHDVTLPYLNKGEDLDPLMVTYQDRVVPNVKAWTANPDKYKDLLKDVVVRRKSKTK